MPKGWDLGVLGVRNLRMWICDDATSTAHLSIVAAAAYITTTTCTATSAASSISTSTSYVLNRK